MAETELGPLLDTFKSGLLHDNFTIQLDAFGKLAKFAKILDENLLQNELLSSISTNLDKISDEAALTLADQLPELAKLAKGDFDIILEILVELAKNDEVLVREQALRSFKDVIEMMSVEQCEKIALSCIQEMINEDFWSRKCSAATLITICYPKVMEETQCKLRMLMKSFAADDMPIVRRSIAGDFITFIKLVDEKIIRSEFIKSLEYLAADPDDSVRETVIDVGAAIAKKLSDFEPIAHIFIAMSSDVSWRVRLRLAENIHTLVPIAKSFNESIQFLEIFKKLVLDAEINVRTISSKNLLNFTRNIRNNHKNYVEFSDEKFEVFFVENIIPLVHSAQTDSDEVRLAFSSDLLCLCTILRSDCFNKHILPLLVDALENESNFECKENILKNMNSLPLGVDITKSLHSTTEFIKDLMEQSNMFWRTRRNLLIAIDHITQHSTSEFFNENIKHFYIQLLYDPVFAVRRTAPILIPALIKQFGFEWAKKHLLPCVISFAKLDKYLLRYVTLFSLEEMIYPSLDQKSSENEERYLGDLHKLISDEKYKKTLIKIVILLTRLSQELDKTEFSEILKAPDEDFNFPNDNFKCYTEDTLDNLQTNRKSEIFSYNPNDNNDNNPTTYLEGVLCLLIRDFFPILQGLLKDDTYNVRVRAGFTLKKLQQYRNDLEKEVKQSWVSQIIKETSEEEFSAVKEEIDQELASKIELSNGLLQNLVKEQTNQLTKKQMGRKMSDFSLPGIEVANRSSGISTIVYPQLPSDAQHSAVTPLPSEDFTAPPSFEDTQAPSERKVEVQEPEDLKADVKCEEVVPDDLKSKEDVQELKKEEVVKETTSNNNEVMQNKEAEAVQELKKEEVAKETTNNSDEIIQNKEAKAELKKEEVAKETISKSDEVIHNKEAEAVQELKKEEVVKETTNNSDELVQNKEAKAELKKEEVAKETTSNSDEVIQNQETEAVEKLKDEDVKESKKEPVASELEEKTIEDVEKQTKVEEVLDLSLQEPNPPEAVKETVAEETKEKTK